MSDIRTAPGIGSCDPNCAFKDEVVRDDGMCQTRESVAEYAAEITSACVLVTGCEAAPYTDRGRNMIARIQEREAQNA